MEAVVSKAKTSVWPAVIAGWLLARLVIAASYLIARTVSFPSSDSDRLSDGLMAWDGGWYRAIAANGYTVDGEDLRFWPLFPAAGRVAGLLFGDDPTLGLLLVANVAALCAAFVAVRYTAMVVPSATEGLARKQAFAVSLSLALWPASFVLAFAYTEGLLVLFSAGAALAARQNRWLAAGTLAVLGGLVRPTGLAIAVLLAMIAVQQRSRFSASVVFAVLSPAIGFAVHLVVARSVGASWDAPITIQEPLRGSLIDPLSRIARGTADLAGDERFGDGLHLPFALLIVGLVVLVWREFGWPEAVFSGLVVLVALSADNWNSLERYALSAFPLVVVPGVVLARVRYAWIAGAGAALIMGSLTTLAWTGHYVP